MIYLVTLPLPPSVNDSLMAVVRGRYTSGKRKGQPKAILAPTKAMEEWKQRALNVVQAKEHLAGDTERTKFAGPVEFFADFFLPSISSDCSNRLKAAEDVLKGFAYDDDKQIVEDHVFKRIARDASGECVRIVVRAAAGAEHAEVARRLEESSKRTRSKKQRAHSQMNDSLKKLRENAAATSFNFGEQETVAERLARLAKPATYRGGS